MRIVATGAGEDTAVITVVALPRTIRHGFLLPFRVFLLYALDTVLTLLAVIAPPGINPIFNRMPLYPMTKNILGDLRMATEA